MSWKFLSVAAVEALHQQQILRYGGSAGLRDRGLLESAVLRAENKAYFEPDAGIAALAATLGWGLIKNHAFIDGNKRIGLVAMVVFLGVNGFGLFASHEQQLDMVLKAAASITTEADWTRWVEQHTHAMP